MKLPTTLAGMWSVFQGAILRNASDFQRAQMRKAFLSGAAVTFTLMTTIVEECGDDEEKGTLRVAALAEEITAFTQELDAEFLNSSPMPAARGTTL